MPIPASFASLAAYGSMIFGISGALLDQSLMADRYGSFMNRDIAE
jgi:hypothetical protein